MFSPPLQSANTRSATIRCVTELLFWLVVLVCLIGFPCAVCSSVKGDKIVVDGFTEPFRTVEVAAPEMGIVTVLHVREGETVKQGQVLATLDEDLYQIQLEIAKSSAEAHGALTSAEAELALRRERLEKLDQLRNKGFARAEEVERARADLSIAEANLLTVQEGMHVKRLEVARIQVQLQRRSVKAPLDGVVNRLLKETGEFVAPNDPNILTVVQLNPLLVNFSVPTLQARKLKEKEQITVRMEGQNDPIQGTVEFLSPVTDAESATVRVKVQLDNAAGQLRSGERCSLELPVQ